MSNSTVSAADIEKEVEAICDAVDRNAKDPGFLQVPERAALLGSLASDKVTKVIESYEETQARLAKLAQARFAKSTDPAPTPYKCKACIKATKVSWFMRVVDVVNALWVFYVKLDKDQRQEVRRLQARMRDGSHREPNKPHAYRFWCAKCKKLVPPKTWWGRRNIYPMSYLDEGEMRFGAVNESSLSIGFRIFCHGEGVEFGTTLVAAYVPHHCHDVVFNDAYTRR